MINLDPKIVDQDAVRRAKRKRLLKISAAPVAFLVLFSLLFLRYGAYTIITNIANNKNNFDLTATLSQGQKIINFFESYIASYNAGVAKLQLHDYAEAEKEFTESLQQDPPAAVLCQVYVNLSYSVEMQGDAAYSSGDFDRALEFYNRAQNTLYNNDCAKQDSNGGKDTKAEQADDRINQKRKNAVQRANGGDEGGDSSSGDETGGEKEPTDEAINDAKKNRIDSEAVQTYIDRARLNELEEAMGGSGGGGGYGGGYNNTTPRW